MSFNDVLPYLNFGLLLTVIMLCVILGIVLRKILDRIEQFVVRSLYQQQRDEGFYTEDIAIQVPQSDQLLPTDSLIQQLRGRSTSQKSKTTANSVCFEMGQESEVCTVNKTGTAANNQLTQKPHRQNAADCLEIVGETTSKTASTFSDELRFMENSSITFKFNQLKHSSALSAEKKDTKSFETENGGKAIGYTQPKSDEADTRVVGARFDQNALLSVGDNPYQFADDESSKSCPYTFALDSIPANKRSSHADESAHTCLNVEGIIPLYQEKSSIASNYDQNRRTNLPTEKTSQISLQPSWENIHKSLENNLGSHKLILRKKNNASVRRINANRLSRVHVRFSKHAGDLHFFNRYSGCSGGSEVSDDDTFEVKDEEYFETDDEKTPRMNSGTFLAFARNTLKNQPKESKKSLDLLPPPLPPKTVRSPLDELHKNQSDLEVASGYLEMKGYEANTGSSDGFLEGRESTTFNRRKKSHRRSVSNPGISAARLQIPSIRVQTDLHALEPGNNLSLPHDGRTNSPENKARGSSEEDSEVEPVWGQHSPNSEYVEMHWRKIR